MNRLQSIEDFHKYKNSLQKRATIQVKVAMATCSKAAGAEPILEFFSQAVEKRGIDAEVSLTGCMGYCYAEPTVEVTLPGGQPVVYGNVTMEKADQIIEQHLKRGETVEGVIPVSYMNINEIS